MVATLVVTGILLGTVAVMACLVIAGKHALRDASNDEQAKVSRSAWKVFVPVTLVAVIASQIAFAVVSHVLRWAIDSPKGFMLYFAVWGVASVPLIALAGVYGGRYRNAGTGHREGTFSR